MSKASSPPPGQSISINKDLQRLIERAVDLEKWPVARLISMFEAEPAAKQGADNLTGERSEILACLHQLTPEKQALVVGITGTPGAGKSSLIGELCLQILGNSPDLSIAVIAVDPSSQQSGGALLGDRTRVRFPANDKRLFFRSQANHLDLGGLGKKTFQAVRLLRNIFDLVIIETVGIGQSELEIDQLSDITCLVLQPLTGDQVQFMKAGIMEVPDIFVVNKCDADELAQKSYHLLKSSLKLISISVDQDKKKSKPIFLTSALKQKGIEPLANHILELMRNPDSFKDRATQEEYYLQKWIRQHYGSYGIKVYDRMLATTTGKLQSESPSGHFYDTRESAFNELIKNMVQPLEDV